MTYICHQSEEIHKRFDLVAKMSYTPRSFKFHLFRLFFFSSIFRCLSCVMNHCLSSDYFDETHEMGREGEEGGEEGLGKIKALIKRAS